MVQINEKGVNLAVLGATGQVGMVMRSILAERNFPIKDLRFLASARSAGQVLNFEGHDVVVEDVATADLLFFPLVVAPLKYGLLVSLKLAPTLLTILRNGVCMMMFLWLWLRLIQKI